MADAGAWELLLAGRQHIKISDVQEVPKCENDIKMI